MLESGVEEAKTKADRNERDIEKLFVELKEIREIQARAHQDVIFLINEIKEENATQKGANKAVLYLVGTGISLIGLAKTLGWL
jgi:queuine/archaeosine tRNA-ribosyltransferase